MESRGKGTKLHAGRLGEIRGVWDSPDIPGPWNGERFKSCLSQWDSVATNMQEIREEKMSAVISCMGDWLEAITEERWWVQLGICQVEMSKTQLDRCGVLKGVLTSPVKAMGVDPLSNTNGPFYHMYFLLGYMYTISSHHVVGITEDIHWMKVGMIIIF